MSAEPHDEGCWSLNYFNYFTEVEEHFQRARGTSLFLMSPLDWALIEIWKNSGIPLEAVLRGIDASFEKWHSRKNKTQMVNSLAYCTQAVMEEAKRMADNAAGLAPANAAAESGEDAPFPLEDVRRYLEKSRATLEAQTAYADITAGVARILESLEEHYRDLQQLDQRLTALEDKMAAIARTRLSDDDLFELRRELDSQLRPYRGKMTADQIARLEKSFLDRRIYEKCSLPRLSLFYLA